MRNLETLVGGLIRLRAPLGWLTLAVVIGGMLTGCRVTGTPSKIASPITAPTARPLATAPSILLGSAVDYNLILNNAQYRETFRSNFDLLVPENEMKFAELEPAQGKFDFTQADTLVNFALSNGMWVRGHTLVWGEHLPDWLTKGKFTRDQVIAILKTHIQTVVSHYRGNVISWDVVNEPFDGANLRNTFWLQMIGPNYIAMAFTWAHEADPTAKLFLNDFGDDEIGPKFDAILSLVTKLRSQGVPINGVGMEMHIGFGAPADPHAVATNMSRLKAAHLEVAVTEIDVQIHNLPGTTQDKLREQAIIYGEMATACKDAGNCHAFVSWGFTDRYTWLTSILGYQDAPLLFDQNYKPKLAFYAVKAALAGESTP